jgi:hypothetical protein
LINLDLRTTVATESLRTNVDSIEWLNLLNNREQFLFQPNVMCHTFESVRLFCKTSPYV